MATVLGLGRHGFYIPYRYAAGVKAPERYPALEPLFRAAEPAMREFLGAAGKYAATLLGFQGEPPAPRWSQEWFPGLDGAAAYVMVRDRAPRRIVEVGSGHSTRFMARAIADGGLATALTAIDPAPRAAIAALDVHHVAHTLQTAPRQALEGLERGDFLFVDSSHIAVPGSDVDLVVTGVLPGLPAGAIVHFHDVLLPFGYPQTWAWRGYNEQCVVAALLVAGGWRILWSSAWARHALADAIAAAGLDRIPVRRSAFETSLWLEKL